MQINLNPPQRRRPNFLSGLGATSFGGAVTIKPAPAPLPVVPPTGLTEMFYPEHQNPVVRYIPKTIVANVNGTPKTIANPDYVPPGAMLVDEIVKRVNAGTMKTTYAPTKANLASKDAWIKSKPVVNFQVYRTGQAQYLYVTNPQSYINYGTFVAVGRKMGYVAKDALMDFTSKAVEYIVEAVVIAAIAYGAYLAAAQAATASTATSASASSASTATSASSAAASDAGMLSAPVSSVTSAAAPVATTATTATSATSAAGIAKTAAGYVKQAKDLLGVAQAIKAATSKKPTAAPVQTLDTMYGSASGGGYGGSGGSPDWFAQLTQGNTPLYIGGGILLLAAVFMVTDSPRRSRGRR